MLCNEEFLSYIWKFRLFNQEQLETVCGEPVRVVATGFQNSNAGPDFEGAKVEIGGTQWAGSIEIHRSSLDWSRHRHFEDEAYNNVVLHVVYEFDGEAIRADNTTVPTIELKDRVDKQIQYKYLDLMGNLDWIPCEKRLSGVEALYLNSWLERVLIERLERKSEEVLVLLREFRGSWDDVFYMLIARNFGFKINALPFELLAKSLPQAILAKHKNNRKQIEALVFGQAGFLEEDPIDQYHGELKLEYAFLKAKYNLKPLQKYLWRFLRLRPANFPTIRLAQFSALIFNSNHLFSKLLAVENVREYFSFFNDLAMEDYWNSHYRFGKLAEKARIEMGKESINNILINTISIALFSYGKYTRNEALVKRGISLLETIPLETNHIISRFKEIGITHGSAAVSQALLQLKKSYCDQKKCLNCGIGIKLLKQNDYGTTSPHIF